jgi:hypothetical protein
LEPDQIVAVVRERTADLPQWEALHRRLEDGDPALLRLFRSPLRLSTALQGYDHTSPDELVDLEPEAARGLLWDVFLRSDESFEGASRDQVRGWLTFLARGMDSRGTQEFALSDLAHYAPGRKRDFYSFRRQFALVGFLVVGGLTGALSALPLLVAAHVIRSSVSAWVEVGVGIVVGLLFASTVRFHTTVAPWVASGVPWRSRWKTVRRRAIHSIVVGTLWVGAGTGLLMLGGSDLLVTTAIPFLWLMICAAAVLDDVVKAGRLDTFGRPPDCLRHQGPAALLDASRRVGSRAGVIAGIAIFALPTIATLPVLLIYVRGLPAALFVEDFGLNLAAGAALAPSFAVRTAVVSGLDAWLYFHWLNRRLARRGLLPRNLPGFLDWCAHPSRQWLRATHVYEFRHRELREHLLGRDTHVAGLAGRAERI